jgi:hypothetical protein
MLCRKLLQPELLASVEIKMNNQVVNKRDEINSLMISGSYETLLNLNFLSLCTYDISTSIIMETKKDEVPLVI